MMGKKFFKVRRLGGVEMRAPAVDQQAQGRFSGAARVERAQPSVLHTDHRHAAFCRHGQPTVRGGGVAPDRHGIIGTG